jgi:hypothetical protein
MQIEENMYTYKHVPYALLHNVGHTSKLVLRIAMMEMRTSFNNFQMLRYTYSELSYLPAKLAYMKHPNLQSQHYIYHSAHNTSQHGINSTDRVN